jgi:16S rRNA (cytosine1407-C5)-methyltransferase
MSSRVPDSFLRHLSHRLGEDAELEELKAACERPLPRTLRLWTRPGVAVDPRQAFEERGLILTPLPFAREGFRVEGSGPPPGASLEHALGLAYVQEAASMIAGEALIRCAPTASRLVLDLCAAPGSKTTQMARGLGPETLVIANEPATSRLKSLVANLVRTQGNAIVTQGDGRATAARLAGTCDAVLVDAPCSGEGTVRRDPKALRGWNRKRFRRFASVQLDLLLSAADALGPGGVLVYSTCALSPEENHEVIRDALAARPELQRLDLRPQFPELAASHDEDGQLWVLPHHHDTGGFFVAALRREDGKAAPSRHGLGAGGFEALTPDDIAQLKSRVIAPYGLSDEDLPLDRVRRRGEALFLALPRALELGDLLEINRIGSRLATRQGGVWFPDHEFLLRFAPRMKNHTRDLERSLARHLLLGNAPAEALLSQESGESPIALRYEGAGIAFATRRGSRPHSLLPRPWILPRVD